MFYLLSSETQYGLLFICYSVILLYLQYQYEILLKKLNDKKIKYKIKHNNLKDHKKYLLNTIQDIRDEEKQKEDFFNVLKQENNNLKFQLMVINKKYLDSKKYTKLYEIQINEYKNKIRKLTNERNILFLEKEKKDYELNKKRNKFFNLKK